MANVKVGIIGGTGLGDALCDNTKGKAAEVSTPFGKPSDAVIQTTWADTPIALISRHGPGHLINPSRVNYRANIYALKALGCTHVIASGAVGSLREKIEPKHLVIPDPSGVELSRAFRFALADSRLSPDDMDYVCSHGIGISGEYLARVFEQSQSRPLYFFKQRPPQD